LLLLLSRRKRKEKTDGRRQRKGSRRLTCRGRERKRGI
jgi:hypothetical protein